MSFKDLLKKEEERAQAILNGEREDGGFHKVLEAVDDKVTNRYELKDEEKAMKKMLDGSKTFADSVLKEFDEGADNEDAKLIDKAREDAYNQR